MATLAGARTAKGKHRMPPLWATRIEEGVVEKARGMRIGWWAKRPRGWSAQRHEGGNVFKES